MRLALALALLLAAGGASAQTSAPAAPAVPVRPVVTLSLGTLSDSGEGALLSAQASVGARRGILTGRLRSTAATSMAFLGDNRDRWEVAALGGVTLGDRAQVFVGAGPGLTGGELRSGCFVSAVCSQDETFPTTLGLALGLDATLKVVGAARIGVQASANLNPSQPTAGVGLLFGFGR